MLWIAYGSLGLLSSALTFGNGGRDRLWGIVPLLLSAAFVITGIQVLTGKARSVLGAGISSIAWGTLQLLVLLVLVAEHAFRGAEAIAVLLGAMVGTLFTGGILAIAGNASYKAWRMTKRT